MWGGGGKPCMKKSGVKSFVSASLKALDSAGISINRGYPKWSLSLKSNSWFENSVGDPNPNPKGSERF